MAWDHLNIDKPHLAYTLIGGFTAVFMLVSLFVKEKLYIGEATVATIFGVIFGPYCAGILDPNSWGNVDRITLEFSRIVLVVQCFAIGVELPKRYMNRHWKSVVYLLLPVMTWGWLIVSLFIWWLIPTLSWLESLACAACVTATDPVLASSVVGKGKFAKRIPKHLRDLLSAESGCNDGMAFPFIYLSLYLIRYLNGEGGAKESLKHWFLYTILYECLFGAIYGFIVGYIGRHAIRLAERHNTIDRESFLVFYFVLALFCAGTGSMLGLDDLLVGFAAGVGFSNDGEYTEKTEEAHVSSVIDLLLNLTFFVYFGAIIPWKQFNAPEWGLEPWRLVVLSIFVLLFRRIPIMVVLKPLIPDIKTWRESLFAGHFGPIGVGAIFVAILARAELETGEPTPLAELPEPGSANYILIEVIWPITTFLIITSILVHGSSIAVFTLGKRINTMSLSMSYTIGTDENGWLSRLPIIQSRLSTSFRKPETDTESSEEKLPFSPGTLPHDFLSNRPDARMENSGKKKRDGLGRGTGVPVIPHGDKSLDEKDEDITHRGTEAYQEGKHIIVEGEDGDVIGVATRRKSLGSPEPSTGKSLRQRKSAERNSEDDKLTAPQRARTKPDSQETLAAAEPAVPPVVVVENEQNTSKPARRRAVANVFRIDDTIILEDQDGEVIKRYRIPRNRDKRRRRPAQSFIPRKEEGILSKLTGFFNVGESSKQGKEKETGGTAGDLERNDTDAYPMSEYDYDAVISEASEDESHSAQPRRKFRIHDNEGRQLTTREMVDKLKHYDAHAKQRKIATQSSLTRNTWRNMGRAALPVAGKSATPTMDQTQRSAPEINAPSVASSATTSTNSPVSNPTDATINLSSGGTADPHHREQQISEMEEETAVERKRREAALGIRSDGEDDADDEEEDGPRRRHGFGSSTIRFAEGTRGKGRA